MDKATAAKEFDRLRKFIDLGPDPDPELLRESIGIVDALIQVATSAGSLSYLKSLRLNFTRWFTPGSWKRGGTEIQEMRGFLLQDMEAAERFW